MNTRSIYATFIFIFLLSSLITAQTVKEDRIAFTVIDAPWMLMLDSENFELTNQDIKPDGKSAYFMLSNKESGLNVSFFIEPAVKCKTSEECRDFVLTTGNPAWGEFQNLVTSKIGDVRYFEFFRPKVRDVPLQVLDMYAQIVEDDYWVDVHLSKILYKKEDHKLFEDFVKSIRFVSKTAKATTETDKTIEAARTSAEDWMVLWDSGKYKESYGKLSTETRKVFDEKTWIDYGTQERKPFGKLKSRKLLRIQLLKSIPNIPELSGAAFSYQSSFENKEKVFETFTITLEKDGNWKVAYYSTNE
jgi:hypothetical protein